MFIKGIGISGYRSFGELQNIGPFGKINIFIGQNNSGKSNILYFILNFHNKFINSIMRGENLLDISEIDIPQHIESRKFLLSMLFLESDFSNDNVKNKFTQTGLRDDHFNNIIRIMFNENSPLWMTFSFETGSKKVLIDENWLSKIKSRGIITDSDWRQIGNALTSQRSEKIEHQIGAVLSWLIKNININHSKIDFIHAIRSIRFASDVTNQEEVDLSGAGIIDRLARLQHPEFNHQSDKEDFNKIVAFVQDVTGNPSATIEIPYARNNINISIDNKVLPLSSLGTGIHEVIILASYATLFRNQVLCIEEPELHMHPLLQKKLLKYLSEKTDNQYFITTHSAHILDTYGAKVFHVRLNEGNSTVAPVENDFQKIVICSDLGYRASDLLQANSIIWVEGPSDRIYLNHWIKEKAPELIEGLHYSIMFYGGRLLNHLSADDKEIEEFISLRRLNQNLCIVIDSDKTNKYKKINATKQRIKNEFSKGPGFAWITKGREIENYIDPGILKRIISDFYHGSSIENFSEFDDVTIVRLTTLNKTKEIDKITLARTVVKDKAITNIMDLDEQIKKLTDFIKSVN